jgi:hypothetical protein
MPSIEQRIEALENEARALRALLARPQEQPAISRADREVEIVELTEGSSAPLPSPEELRSLYATVLRAYPQLATKRCLPRSMDIDYESAFAEFSVAFIGLCHVRRISQPDPRHAASWWIDHVEDTLQKIGRSATVTLPAFTAAVLAHGDIAFFPVDMFPYELGFGLAHGGTGRAYSGEWRTVLQTRKLAMPMKPPRARTSTTYSQPIIRGGDNAVG